MYGLCLYKTSEFSPRSLRTAYVKVARLSRPRRVFSRGVDGRRQKYSPRRCQPPPHDHADAETASSTTSAASGVFISLGGTSCQNFFSDASQSASTAFPFGDPVFSTCASINVFSCASPAAVHTRCIVTISPFTLDANVSSSSRKYPNPPVIPAPTFRPTLPSETTHPPVMYSQQWSPVPSTTASAREFLTAKRSPARPFMNTLPPVAPYRHVFPAMMQSSGLNVDAGGGMMDTSPPDMDLHT
mmetsp:Transcript_2839/g.9215  ORF Transcript_2839/g.9215 Transcript_2839/m.9215 type:complete len:243 (-) Transcript_2839:4592-5320(-)